MALLSAAALLLAMAPAAGAQTNEELLLELRALREELKTQRLDQELREDMDDLRQQERDNERLRERDERHERELERRIRRGSGPSCCDP